MSTEMDYRSLPLPLSLSHSLSLSPSLSLVFSFSFSISLFIPSRARAVNATRDSPRRCWWNSAATNRYRFSADEEEKVGKGLVGGERWLPLTPSTQRIFSVVAADDDDEPVAAAAWLCLCCFLHGSASSTADATMHATSTHGVLSAEFSIRCRQPSRHQHRQRQSALNS